MIEEPLPGELSGVFEQVDRQTTFVIVTDKPSTANVAERIIELKEGTLVDTGTNEKPKGLSDLNAELPIEMESEEPNLASAATDQPTMEQISKKNVSLSTGQYNC